MKLRMAAKKHHTEKKVATWIAYAAMNVVSDKTPNSRMTLLLEKRLVGQVAITPNRSGTIANGISSVRAAIRIVAAPATDNAVPATKLADAEKNIGGRAILQFRGNSRA